MNRKWEFYNQDENLVQKIAKEHNISELLAVILVNRGITQKKDIDIFLNPTRKDFHDPYSMPDMEKAVNRILKAIDEKEKVIIYGDYDVDGITSITVLKKFLKERGLDVGYYIPNRLDEGYGLNKDAIEKIAEEGYKLIITVDCGISGIEEIKFAYEKGMEVIVTDHHEPLEELPDALAVVDCKRKDNKYPFKNLAGCGVVFKLAQAISQRLNLDEKEYLKYLDIVCVGTISDIVPLVDENRVIAKLGLKLVEQTRNPGLKALLVASGYKEVNSNTVSFGVAPRINACGRMGYSYKALDLLLEEDYNKALEIASEIKEFNNQRQAEEKHIFEEANEQIKEKHLEKEDSIILGGNSWHSGVIGIVASKITEMYFRPSILICFDDDENIGKGSGRSIPGFDLHDALMKCKDNLSGFGGHSMAVGVSVDKNNFEKFIQDFLKIAKEADISSLVPVLNIDAILNIDEITKNMIESMSELEPFGEANPMPVFAFKGLKIASIRSLTDGKHLKLGLKSNNNTYVNAIGFNLGHFASEFKIGDKIDVAGNLEINSFNGVENIQINLKDIMKSI